MRSSLARLLAAPLAFAALASPAPARACGCFAIPNPADPVVQAGEQILFASDGTNVIAHIKIQYQGPPSDFGWLLPLPSLPEVSLSTNQLFDQLTTATAPAYVLTTVRDNCYGGSTSSSSSGLSFGCGSGDSANYDPLPGTETMDMGTGGPLVQRSSIGPYDYAVLKADDQTAMLDWLQQNRYFIPATTSDVIAPYIHPGAYFLALKLRSGEATGDIQPVAVRYPSDLPMIPIVLTQTGAVPDMGILVWVLGETRAVPRNYHHMVLNDMAVWLANGTSYEAIVARATREDPQRHAFLTDYAGPSAPLHGALAPPGRFGSATVLAAITDPVEYLSYLLGHGFVLDDTLVGVLLEHLPEPPAAIAAGITPQDYFSQFGYWWKTWAESDAGAPPSFDPVATTDAVEQRVVAPTQAAQQLIDAHPYLTRLFTTLSPADMTVDPVFDFDPDLPPVSAIHTAKLTYPCRAQAWLAADDGLAVQWPAPSSLKMPDSLRIEVIGEAGPPTVVFDHTQAIQDALGPVQETQPSTGASNPPASDPPRGGCACSLPTGGHGLRGDLIGLAVALAVAFALRRTRRAG
jgi:hypothetical protein